MSVVSTTTIMQFNELDYHFASNRKDVSLSLSLSLSLSHTHTHLCLSRVLANDICSFRAMTVALTVSFKLISF